MVKLAIIIPKEARPYIRQLKPRQKAVWLALQGFKNKAGIAWPTVEKLADESGVPAKHIARTTRDLAELGLLTKEGSGGRNRPAHYTMLEPWKHKEAPQTTPKAEGVSTAKTTPKAEGVSVSAPAPQNHPQNGGKTTPKTGGRIELSIEQSILRSEEEHQDFVKNSGEEKPRSRMHAPAPTHACEASDPTPPDQPHPPAPEPMPWDIEDEDDVPPWEREQTQQPENLRSKPEELPAKPEELPAKPEEREQLTLLPAPAEKKKKRKGSEASQKPDDVSQEVWDEWVKHRKKKSSSISVFVVNIAREKAQAVGWTLERYFAEWVLYGTIGFDPEWILKKQRQQNSGSAYKPAAQIAKEEQMKFHDAVLGPAYRQMMNEYEARQNAQQNTQQTSLMLLEQ